MKVFVGKLVEGSNLSPRSLCQSIFVDTGSRNPFSWLHDLPICWRRILLTPVPFRFGHCSLPQIGIPRSLSGMSWCRVARPVEELPLPVVRSVRATVAPIHSLLGPGSSFGVAIVAVLSRKELLPLTKCTREVKSTAHARASVTFDLPWY